MKRKLLNTTIATTAFVLLTASALADAACDYRPCLRVQSPRPSMRCL